MKGRKTVLAACLVVGAAAFGQVQENFLQQQAYAEMQRVSGQVDVLQANFSELQQRVGALERTDDTQGVRQELDALKAAVAEIRREMQAMRGEIVRDLAGRIAKLQAPPAPKCVARPVERSVEVGPHIEYTVVAGDNLSIIAQAFNTSVAKIREMNALKGDVLYVGQKLKLPK